MSNLYQQGMQQQLPYKNNYYQQVVKIPSNPIGDEGVRTLLSTNNKVFFSVTQKDIWETLCYHTHNGDFRMTKIDPNRNIFKCDICGETVNLDADITDQDLQAAIDLILIAWQQAKIYNSGVVSTDIMYDNAQCLAVMKKFPQLFKFIKSNFNKNSVQAQQLQTSVQNVGQAAYNAIHSTSGFFQPTIQQPVMYAPQQPVYQPQYAQQPQTIPMQPQYQPQPQQQITYSYEQQPPQPQYQPVNQQPPMPQNVPPPAATGTVVPEQQAAPPPVAYPPKGQQVPPPAGREDTFKRALGFNL